MHEFDRMEVEYIKNRLKEVTSQDRNTATIAELAALAEVYIPGLIKQLEKSNSYSESQAQALDMMERGQL